MPGKLSEKRSHARAMRASEMSLAGATHRDIADAIGCEPEQVKAKVLLGERLSWLPEQSKAAGEAGLGVSSQA